MHEYSIVQSLIDSCEEHVKANCATKVTKVVVKIGVLSGVEPHLLEEAFNMFKEESICEGAEFVMNIQKTELEKNEFVCPKCSSYEIKVLDGEDMFLMQLELE